MTEALKARESSIAELRITSMLQALGAAEPRPLVTGERGPKKNYAERLSRCIAVWIANGLRRDFPGILPGPSGERQESRALTGRGPKKLDINFSTPELGLGLGISVKTINFRDPVTGRYTKNYSRIDNELRAEATDYHSRQPYAVLVGVLFLPYDSCDDAGKRADVGSSFAEAVRFFRRRTGRERPSGPDELMEGFFVALYEYEGDRRGDVRFFDVAEAPPRGRRLRESEGLLSEEFLKAVTAIFVARNQPEKFVWAD